MTMHTPPPRRRPRRTKRRNRKPLVLLVAVLLAAGLTWHFWPNGQARTDPNAAPATTAGDGAGGQQARGDTPGGGVAPLPPRDDDIDAPGRQPPAEPTDSPGPTNSADRLKYPFIELTQPPGDVTYAEAHKAYQAGREAHEKGKLLEARQKLNQALLSRKLDPAANRNCRQRLTQIALKTVFSSTVFPDDPLTFQRTFAYGEVLAGANGVIRKESLRVPSAVIVAINRLPEAGSLQAGRRYKMIRGPFHAVVDKSDRTLDLYLQDTFIRRYRVCIGAERSPTPEGFFRLALRGKTINTPYYPPAGSNLPRRVMKPGEPGYPLDPRGHNIKLEGIEELGTLVDVSEGYAIHGTDDPASIGEAASLGCIRLGSRDIAELYRLLYEHWSTVTILP